MASKTKVQDEKNLKILRELAALPSNRYCFECSQRGPTYVDITVGSFVCSTCSGLLRGIHPPHRVKSITMTSFTPEEMEQIKSKGNEYCKQVWLGKYDPSTCVEMENHNPSMVKEFLIQKYEDKKFYVEPEFVVKKPKSRAPSVPNNNNGTVTQSKSQTAIPTNRSPSKLVQKPSWTSQTFSSIDKADDLSGFSDAGKSNSSTEVESENCGFADFSSAFANTGYTFQQQQVVDSSDATKECPSTSAAAPKPSIKKHAPPPPDRYAALADLDNQLHHNQLHYQQQQQHQQPAMPAMTAAVPIVDQSGFIWCGNYPGGTAIALQAGVPVPLSQAMSTWSANTGSVATANPFQTVVPQPQNQFAKPMPFLFTPMVNGGSGDRMLQPGDPYWAAAAAGQHWLAATFPGGHHHHHPQMEVKFAAPPPPQQQFSPWPKNLGAEAANPFMNGTSPAAPQNGSTNNPFL